MNGSDRVSRRTPIFATERSAASLLDMSCKEFRRLVESGALPPAKKVGDLDRWDVDELQQIIRGEVIEGMGEVAW